MIVYVVHVRLYSIRYHNIHNVHTFIPYGMGWNMCYMYHVPYIHRVTIDGLRTSCTGCGSVRRQLNSKMNEKGILRKSTRRPS